MRSFTRILGFSFAMMAAACGTEVGLTEWGNAETSTKLSAEIANGLEKQSLASSQVTPASNEKSRAVETGAPSAPSEESLSASNALAPATEQSVTASACWHSGGKWWCHNLVPTPIYPDPLNGHKAIDNLRTNPSFFNCRYDGGDYVGGPHSHRWLFTQGDDHGRWGWVKDTAIPNETNSLPVCIFP